MQLPILPLHDLEIQSCFLEEFFFDAYQPHFVYSAKDDAFLYYNKAFSTLVGYVYGDNPTIALNPFYAIMHKDDLKAIQTVFKKSQVIQEGKTSLNIRINVKYDEEQVFHLHTKHKQLKDGNHILLGTLQNISDKIRYEQLQQKSDNTFRELSFITSHELRHEYAKIQSIIQILDKDIVSEIEKKELIEGARESIQIINNTIFKINHKLSFNQRDPFFAQTNQKKSISRVILVDDDHLTNIINKRVIKNAAPLVEVEIFSDTEEALKHLTVTDKKGDLLILLDVNFPFGSGWDFLDKYELFPIQSRVVVLSSSIDTRDRARASNYASVSDYLTKPLSLERIKSLLGI
jgi:CheY-like chemotaxis protein